MIRLQRTWIEENAPIATWFGVGGGCARLARPQTSEDLAECLREDPHLRVLGAGANLLVHERGVRGLVVALSEPMFTRVTREGDALCVVGAGVDLPKFIVESVRLGLAGVEGLGGIPATIGGALVMNAGGAFGQIADVVRRVHALTRKGEAVTLERSDIAFGYRTSGLDEFIVTGAELQLRPADAAALRATLKDVMEYKKKSQPMSASSAGCCFKNPTLERDVAGIGLSGQRVSAGMLIDRAGLKGARVGSALVSERHANFLTVADKATGKASDVIALMERVERVVHEAFGVRLKREVVVWGAEEERA